MSPAATPPTLLTPPQTAAPTHVWRCSHCALPVPGFKAAAQTDGDIAFCCEGCRAVYQIITGCSLEQYYAIKKESAWFASPSAAAPGGSRYGYLDDPSVRAKFAVGPAGRSMDFYIEGVHCVACLWLLEKIGVLVGGVRSARMDLGTRILRVEIGENGSFAAAAEGIDRLGYKPHPVCGSEDTVRLWKTENRQDLARIGVAAFCTMNIMIFFVSIYGGAEGVWLEGFKWMSGLLYVPVAAFSAVPFYKSAWSSLRARQLHIDLPVAVAIVIGSASSYAHLFAGSEQIYFDSIASFVFLLLSVRYLLKTVHQKAASHNGAGDFLIPASALRLNAADGSVEAVSAERIRVQDLVRVPHGEVIPVDGEVEGGSGYADLHMLSGESEPVALHPGSSVYAGTVNVGPELTVRVAAAGPQTRIGRLLRNIASEQKPSVVRAADLAAKIYLAAILTASAWLLIFGGGLSFGQALDRALAMIIIACPCALALVTPLAYRLASGESSAAGVLLKNAETLEKIADAERIFLDKTGTVTHGRFGVLDWRPLGNGDMLAAEAYALEKNSKHPIAYAIRDYAGGLLEASAGPEGNRLAALPEPEDHVETLGVGVAGTIGGERFEIRGIETLDPADPAAADNRAGQAEAPVRSEVGIFKNGALAVRVRLGDRVRPDSSDAVHRLKEQFERVDLISGDRQKPVSIVAAKLGISQATAQMDPESKRALLAGSRRSIMVGDGANDAPAMAAAGVSIAVQGSIEVSLQCADAYLAVPGIAAVPELVAIARRTRAAIRWALAASFVYNLIGMGLALTGRVTPLVAAIAMPVSSVTVLGICYAGIRRPRVKKWK